MLQLIPKLLTVAGLVFSLAQPALAADENDVNPLRLSYINGQVSFWRYGAEDWAQAHINTPLARGDALYVGHDSELELQAESRAFIRAADDTQISLVEQTPDYLQVKVTGGRVSFDLRSLPSNGYVVEVDTPNAVFTIDRPGYYRIDVNDDVHFVTRRGGHATVIPAGGQSMSVQPSEEIVVQGGETARAEAYAAPELDGWDHWNYDRTNDLVDAMSERYLPPGVAGASELDHYGSWRVVEDYGSVWVPDDVPAGWVPYSTGRWIWDPYYQWTWIDDAPWGWAPFHYGRWICRNNYWMWAPGTVRVRPVYAPALVAFYGQAPVRSGVSVTIGGTLGWVALSWGEPLRPWWGRPGFVGRPWWGGWGGPRVVNNTVINQTNIVNINQINYANSRFANAVVTAPTDRFGKADVRSFAVKKTAPRDMRPLQGAVPVQPSPTALVAGAPRAAKPPEQIVARPVIAVRKPPEVRVPWQIDQNRPSIGQGARIVTPQPLDNGEMRRPQFGTQTGPERQRAPLPPKYERSQRSAAPMAVQPAPVQQTTPPTDVRVVPAPHRRESDRDEIRNSTLRPQEPTMPTMRSAPPQTQPAIPESSERSSSMTLQRQSQPQNAPEQGLPDRRGADQPGQDQRERRPFGTAVPPVERRESTPAPQPLQSQPQRSIEAPVEHSRERSERPERSRQELPGKPANQIFRRAPQENAPAQGNQR
jgi:hypothetical protein